MIVLTGPLLLGLSAVISSIALLVWAIRRDPKNPGK